MTGFRQVIWGAVALISLLLSCPQAAFAQPKAADPLAQLQQENAALRLQVKRLEAQVAAQREDLSNPGPTQIIGGIGYIIGVFGIVGWIAARKKSPQENS